MPKIGVEQEWFNNNQRAAYIASVGLFMIATWHSCMNATGHMQWLIKIQ
jgi:hypothetical protein